MVVVAVAAGAAEAAAGREEKEKAAAAAHRQRFPHWTREGEKNSSRDQRRKVEKRRSPMLTRSRTFWWCSTAFKIHIYPESFFLYLFFEAQTSVCSLSMELLLLLLTLECEDLQSAVLTKR